jgi:hypothetical protein
MPVLPTSSRSSNTASPFYFGGMSPAALRVQSNVVLFKTWNVGAIAGKVTVPVVLQWCGYDMVISQDQRLRSSASPTPRSISSAIPTWAFPMWEQPDRFSADLGKFPLPRHTHQHSDGEAKVVRLRTAPDSFRTAGACRTLADRYERAFDERLATEAATPVKTN